jgi:hypothetical protein
MKWPPRLAAADGQVMTLREAKSIARHLGLTLRKMRSDDYRVNFRDGNETTACYTDNLEDAVNTAVEMAPKRASAAARDERTFRLFPEAHGGMDGFALALGSEGAPLQADRSNELPESRGTHR